MRLKTTVTVTESVGYLTPSTRSATKTLTPLPTYPSPSASSLRSRSRINVASIVDVVNYVPA